MGRKNFITGKYIFLFIAGLIFSFLIGCATVKDMQKRQDSRSNLLLGQKLISEGDYNGALEINEKVLSEFPDDPPGDEALFNIGLIYAHYGNPGKDYWRARRFFAKLIGKYPRSVLVQRAQIWVAVLEYIDALETIIDRQAAAESQRSPDKTAADSETDSEKTADDSQDSPDKTAANSQTSPDKAAAHDKHLIRGQKLLEKGDFKGSLAAMQKALSISSKNTNGDKALFYMGLIYAHYNNPDKDYKKSSNYFKKIIKDYPKSPFVEQSNIWLGVLNVIEKAKQVDIEIEKKKKELSR